MQLICDGWTDGKGRSITNFLVNSASGTVFFFFFKYIDTSQVVTDGASHLVAAGRMLTEKRTKLFWSPCAAHSLDLVLEDIGKLPVFYNIISNAKKITTYKYRHTWVLNLYRKYSNGRN